jgi:hypothetical protein
MLPFGGIIVNRGENFQRHVTEATKFSKFTLGVYGSHSIRFSIRHFMYPEL